MAYEKGQIISKDDYSNFVRSINQVYSVASWSGPDATYNYGATPPIANVVAKGDDITAKQWTDLLETIRKISIHQGTPINGSVPFSVNKGDLIVTLDNLPSVINTLRANRLRIDPGEISLSTGKVTKNRQGNWLTKLTQTITVKYGTHDIARYFFNSGGDIRLTSVRTGGSARTTVNQTWTDLLNKIGTVRFNWEKGMSLNNYRNNRTIGFYNLTTSYQIIYEATPQDTGSGGYYATESYRIEAKYDNAGSVDFRISWLSGDANIKDGTISTSTDELRSSGEIPFTGTVNYSSTEITGS